AFPFKLPAHARHRQRVRDLACLQLRAVSASLRAGARRHARPAQFFLCANADAGRDACRQSANRTARSGTSPPACSDGLGRGALGMRAVAHVMVNRIGDRFGDDLQTVILAPKQFSAWNIGDPNRPLAQNPERYATGGLDKVTWDTAQEVAREVLSGQSVDPTG